MSSTPETTPSSVIQAGVYEHYKGQRYLVLGLAHDSNHDGRTAVVYVPLYDAPGPRLAVRDHADFRAWVHADGSTCVVDECDTVQGMLATHGRVQMGAYSQTHRPRFRLVADSPSAVPSL